MNQTRGSVEGLLTEMSFLPAKRILVLQRGLLGDMVAVTPTLARLRCMYPDASIAVLGNSYNIGILAGNPSVDKIFVHRKVSVCSGWLSKFMNWLLNAVTEIKIFAFSPNLSILATGQADYHGYKTLTRHNAGLIVGYRSRDGKCNPDLYLDEQAQWKLHEVQAIYALLSLLGDQSQAGEMQVFNKYSCHKTEKRPLAIAIQLEARLSNRNWPKEKINNLVSSIRADYPDITISLFSQGESRDVMQSNKVKLVSPKCIAEYICELSMCDVYIGPEGGGVHIACGLGLPVLGLYANNPKVLVRWGPWNILNESKIVISNTSLIKDIGCDEVYKTFVGLLNNLRYKPRERVH